MTSRWLLILIFLCLAGWVLARDARVVRRPLDLPSGGLGVEDDEENVPESIHFYGGVYEGDAFFWCFDRSNSMSPYIGTVKAELTAAINQLSAEAEFSVVRFSTGAQSWSHLPELATTMNKSFARTWVDTTTVAGATCITPAVIQTLNIASHSAVPLRRVILLGDGAPACDGGETTLEDITNANYESIPIDTIYIGGTEEGMQLFQAIAESNNGVFSTPSP